MTTTSELVPDLVDEYLTFLGYADRPAPTVASLVELHQRHLARVPYENLEIMLGRPPSVAPLDSLARVRRVGRAGYCFHQNGALEVALRELGFAVERRHGHVWTSEDDRHTGLLNHLVLAVTGFVHCERDGNASRYWVNDQCLERFPSAAELIMGVLPRYEPQGPECLAPWQTDHNAVPTGRRSTPETRRHA